jgi:hypothetical protein
MVALAALYRLLPVDLDQFQHTELFLCYVRQRDRQPDALSVQEPEARPYESAIRRAHRLVQAIFRTAGGRGSQRWLSSAGVGRQEGRPARSCAGAVVDHRVESLCQTWHHRLPPLTRLVARSCAFRRALHSRLIRPSIVAASRIQRQQRFDRRAFSPS